MDWNLKPPPTWDLTELEQEPFSNLDQREDFSVDLKLGQVGNSGNDLVIDTWKDKEIPGQLAKPASSPSGSSKRSRGSYGASQAVSCLVDGCVADLSGCRDYHRRHKVCEIHSKTPQVTIGGHKQRFCQQCSRFHSLEEFDDGKRSCRKRLDGHNRRRRKPQPESFSRYGALLSNYTGTQLLPFSSSLVYPSTAVVSPSWGGVTVKTEAESGPHNPHPQLSFLDKQSPFLGPSSPATSVGYKAASNKAFALTEGDRVALYDRPNPQAQGSDCALSLLSSSQTGLGHHDMAVSPLGSFPAGPALHCPVMFHHLGSDGSGNEEAHHQTLPSHWG